MNAYIYTLVAITVLGIASVFPVARRFSLILSFSILVALAGLRFEIGWDYEAYQDFFNVIDSQDITESFGVGGVIESYGFESGYSLLIWLLTLVDANYQFVLAVITVGLCFLAANHIAPKSSIGLFVVIYMWYGYYHNFSILRQGLAAALIFLAFALLNRRRKYFLGVLALASTIHLSSLVLAPVLWFFVRIANKKVILLALAICWILSIYSFSGEILGLLLSLTGRERWLTLLDIGELTTKVGVSLILVEYTLLTLLILTINASSYAIKFAMGVILYRIITYGFFNDISIVWERTNSFSDPMYALAISVIILTVMAKFTKNTHIFRLTISILIIIMSSYVTIKYSQMLLSEPRVSWERSHYERFVPYRSIFDK